MNHKLIKNGKLRLIFLGLLVALGGIVAAQAALPHIKYEAEAGSRSGFISVISDAQASAGQGVQFGGQVGPSGKKCVVSLHGKGGDGGAPWQNGDTTWLFPTGNGDGGGWGPHHWEYATSTTYNQALVIITNELTPHGCGQISLIGFSNGAAMAAKVFCQGQNFTNRLVGVIVDDPVPDQVVDNCAAASGVDVRLIMSNDMGWITDGTPCPGGWTCQGTLYGRATYQTKLGAPAPLIKQSHTPSNDVYAGYLTPWWN